MSGWTTKTEWTFPSSGQNSSYRTCALQSDTESQLKHHQTDSKQATNMDQMKQSSSSACCHRELYNHHTWPENCKSTTQTLRNCSANGQPNTWNTCSTSRYASHQCSWPTSQPLLDSWLEPRDSPSSYQMDQADPHCHGKVPIAPWSIANTKGCFGTLSVCMRPHLNWTCQSTYVV